VSALPLPIRLAVGAAHVGVIVAVAAGCFLLPIPLGLLVLTGRPHRELERCRAT
jgi:hypothetical protein